MGMNAGYKVGDWVRFTSGKNELVGEVTHAAMHTSVRCDGGLMTVPSSWLWEVLVKPDPVFPVFTVLVGVSHVAYQLRGDGYWYESGNPSPLSYKTMLALAGTLTQMCKDW